VAGQGAQHGHSDPSQLGHGVSAYRDGDRHVRQRAVLEGEAQHVRLVVGVGRTRSEQAEEDWSGRNSGGAGASGSHGSGISFARTVTTRASRRARGGERE